jgi:CheY-like chemotaxis protein
LAADGQGENVQCDDLPVLAKCLADYWFKFNLIPRGLGNSSGSVSRVGNHLNSPLVSLFTFLVVDDDPDGGFFTERSLSRIFGACQVIVCRSGNLALAKLASGTQPHAIVTDHHLGTQTGADFIRTVRQSGHTCPIVMVTCSADPKVFSEALAAGASRVFETGGDGFAEFLKHTLHETVS